MSSEVKNYNPFARLLHWGSALIIFGMFAVGLWMVDLNYYSSWYQTAPHWHKSIGVLLALITIIRIIWKLVSAAPQIEGSALVKMSAHAVHRLLYALMFVLFISGYLISTSDGRGVEVFDWFTVVGLGEWFPNQSDISGIVHYYSAIILIGFAVLHAAAAIKHHVVDKDNTLRKMIGASK